MKPGSNPRRLRNRGNGKRPPGRGNQTFESAGPEGKIRGTAQQVLDRYLVLGRDAALSGDIITAESFFQHAEHYYRVLNAYEDGEARRSAEWNRQPRVEMQQGADAEGDGMNDEAVPVSAVEG